MVARISYFVFIILLATTVITILPSFNIISIAQSQDDGGDGDGNDDGGDGDGNDDGGDGDGNDDGGDGKTLDEENFPSHLLSGQFDEGNMKAEEINENRKLDIDEQNFFKLPTALDPNQETLTALDPNQEKLIVVGPDQETNCSSNQLESNGNCIAREGGLKYIKEFGINDFVLSDEEEEELNQYFQTPIKKDQLLRLQVLADKANLVVYAMAISGSDSNNPSEERYIVAKADYTPVTALRGDYESSRDSDNQVKEDNNYPNSLDNDPIKILKYRLAIGEITIEEYDKLKEILISQVNLTP